MERFDDIEPRKFSFVSLSICFNKVTPLTETLLFAHPLENARKHRLALDPEKYRYIGTLYGTPAQTYRRTVVVR